MLPVRDVRVTGKLQQKKSQKGNWEQLPVSQDAAIVVPLGYNKRNPKKGIESRAFVSDSACEALCELQQKKSQKGNWERSSPWWPPRGQQTSYNKRNPKKGIESFVIHALNPLRIPSELQQKKSQKGNWEPIPAPLGNHRSTSSLGYNKRNPKKGIERAWITSRGVVLCTTFLLQQKKSQKGNWEFTSSSSPILAVFGSYNKRNTKKGIESSEPLAYRRLAKLMLQQKKSQKGNWEPSPEEPWPSTVGSW